MMPGKEKEVLTKFCRNNHEGVNYVKQYVLDETHCSGIIGVCRILKRMCKKSGPNLIVVLQENIVNAIDTNHCERGHEGVQNTWNDCTEIYFNVPHNLVKLSHESCWTCMKK